MFDVIMWILGRRPQKNTANGLVRSMRRGRPLTSQTAFGGQLPYKGSLVSPVVRFHYSPFEYNGRLLRATNHEPRATIFPRIQMRRTAATDSGWYYDRVPIVINSGCIQDSRRYAFQASPTVSHTGDGKGHGHRSQKMHGLQPGA